MKFALLLFVCFAVAYCVQATGGGGGGSGTTAPSGGGCGTTAVSGGGGRTTLPPKKCYYCNDNTILRNIICRLQGILGIIGLLPPGSSAGTCVKCGDTGLGGSLGSIICELQELINGLVSGTGGGEDGKGCYYCNKPNGGIIDRIVCLVLRVIDILGLGGRGTNAANCVRCIRGSNIALEQLICSIQDLLAGVVGPVSG